MVLPVNEQTHTSFAVQCTRRVGAEADWTAGGSDGVFDIFAITGGPIIVDYLFVTVTIDTIVGAATPLINFTPTGGAPVAICAEAASVAGDLVNGMLVWDGQLLGQLAPTAGDGIIDVTEMGWTNVGGAMVLVPGMIHSTNGAGGAAMTAGALVYYMLWRPTRQPCEVIAQ